MAENRKAMIIDRCAAKEPRAPNGSPDKAEQMYVPGIIRRAGVNKAVRMAISSGLQWPHLTTPRMKILAKHDTTTIPSPTATIVVPTTRVPRL
jgi:hypothetical protein